MTNLFKTCLALGVSAMFISTAPAQAASLSDVLQQLNTIDPTKIEELSTVAQQLRQGDKQPLVSLVTRTVLERVNIAVPIGQEIKSTQDVVSVLKQSVTDNVKGRVEQEVNKRLNDFNPTIPFVDRINAILNPAAQTSQTAEAVLNVPPVGYKKVMDMTATAYAPGPHDNGKWGNLTYTGGAVKHGIVAVDPTVIPMGTKLWVEGYGYALADDQGSAIKGMRIDLAFDTLPEAYQYGIKNVKVYVLE